MDTDLKMKGPLCTSVLLPVPQSSPPAKSCWAMMHPWKVWLNNQPAQHGRDGTEREIHPNCPRAWMGWSKPRGSIKGNGLCLDVPSPLCYRGNAILRRNYHTFGEESLYFSYSQRAGDIIQLVISIKSKLLMAVTTPQYFCSQVFSSKNASTSSHHLKHEFISTIGKQVMVRSPVTNRF